MGLPALLATVAGLVVLLPPQPVQAHPLTGGPATPGQVAVTVAGLVLVVVGGAGAFTTAGTEPRRGIARIGRAVGTPALLLGLLTVFVGPDVVTRLGSRCSVRPSTTAALQVTSPSEGQRFPTGAVPFVVDVVGGELADPGVSRLQRGKGHLQISVDRVLVARAATPVQVLQLSEGRHRVLVEYVAGDHLPFCPKVAVARTVEVGA